MSKYVIVSSKKQPFFKRKNHDFFSSFGFSCNCFQFYWIFRNFFLFQIFQKKKKILKFFFFVNSAVSPTAEMSSKRRSTCTPTTKPSPASSIFSMAPVPTAIDVNTCITRSSKTWKKPKNLWSFSIGRTRKWKFQWISSQKKPYGPVCSSKRLRTYCRLMRRRKDYLLLWDIDCPFLTKFAFLLTRQIRRNSLASGDFEEALN